MVHKSADFLKKKKIDGTLQFLCPFSPLCEPSTLSCKAAGSLFRHHFHINAARELAGQHLMRR